MADYSQEQYQAVQDAFRHRGIDAASGGETAEERYKRIATEVGSGARTIESVGTSLDPYAAYDPDTYGSVRSAFEDRGLGIATGTETEEERLHRLALAIATGDRSLEGLGLTLDKYAPVTATDTTVGKSIDDLRGQSLEAALALIGSQYDLQRGDLRGQQAALGHQYEQLMRAHGLQTEAGFEQIENSAADRGILRSGIYAGDRSEFGNQMAEQGGAIERQYSTTPGSEGTEWQRLQSALLLIDQQQQQEEDAARLQKEQDELEMEQLEALAAAGLA